MWAPGAELDTLAFHRESAGRATMMAALIASQLDVCAHVRNTAIFACTRERLPAGTFDGVPIDVLPASFHTALFLPRDTVAVDDRGIVLRSARALTGSLGVLPRGNYEWTVSVATDQPAARDGLELARLEVIQAGATLGAATADPGGRELTLRFAAGDSQEPLAYRFTSYARTPLVITAARMRRQPDAAPARL
jgi:hypothetical protein